MAIDGKSAPQNRPGGPDDGRMLLAAITHGDGLIAGQTASDGAGGEIVGARRLIRELDVRGHVLTLDALHSCPKTARLILDQGADYALPIKDNHPSVREDLVAFDAAFGAAPTTETLDKGHGRLERRSCALLSLEQHPDDCRDAARRSASAARAPS